MKGRVRSKALQRDFQCWLSTEKAPHGFLPSGSSSVPGALGREKNLESPFGKSFSSKAYLSFQDVDGGILGGIWAGVHLSG